MNIKPLHIFPLAEPRDSTTLSGDLDLIGCAKCLLCWSAGSALSQKCNSVATSEEQECETPEGKMAHSGLAKWSMANLRQDDLGTHIVKIRKYSSLSIWAKTIPHPLHHILMSMPEWLEWGLYSSLKWEIRGFGLPSKLLITTIRGIARMHKADKNWGPKKNPQGKPGNAAGGSLVVCAL